MANLILLPLFFAVFYFLLIRPHRSGRRSTPT